jgi:hypothetical protein
MPVFTSQAATVFMLTAIQVGSASNAPTIINEPPVCKQAVWAVENAGTEAEWEAIARSAPSSNEIRAIAQYLLDTGQAAT